MLGLQISQMHAVANFQAVVVSQCFFRLPLLQIQQRDCSAFRAGPGSHWCGNVGRAHASNNVHFVAHLREGRFAQKCHDPDCAGYRSPWAPLPEALRLAPHGGGGG